MSNKTSTEITLEDDFETPLVIIALQHEITREDQYAKAAKDRKKKLFHQFNKQKYQGILDAIQNATW